MDEPRVTVSDKLAAYLAKKGHRYILMSVATCKSCGGAVGELYARPLKDDEAHRLIDGNRSGLRRLPCYGPGGEALAIGGKPVELLVQGRAIRLDEGVALNLRRALGLADIRVEGARF